MTIEDKLAAMFVVDVALCELETFMVCCMTA